MHCDPRFCAQLELFCTILGVIWFFFIWKSHLEPSRARPDAHGRNRGKTSRHISVICLAEIGYGKVDAQSQFLAESLPDFRILEYEILRLLLLYFQRNFDAYNLGCFLITARCFIPIWLLCMLLWESRNRGSSRRDLIGSLSHLSNKSKSGTMKNP